MSGGFCSASPHYKKDFCFAQEQTVGAILKFRLSYTSGGHIRQWVDAGSTTHQQKAFGTLPSAFCLLPLSQAFTNRYSPFTIYAMLGRPEPNEAATYYSAYINLVAGENIL